MAAKYWFAVATRPRTCGELTNSVFGRFAPRTPRSSDTASPLRPLGVTAHYVRLTHARVSLNSPHVGHPAVPIAMLDSVTTSELLIVPHISKGGPNGIWHIERGDRHPLVLAASQWATWCHVNDDGQPSFFCTPGHDVLHIDSHSAHGADLFTSIDGATAFADHINEDNEPKLAVKSLTTRELLSCLSRVDIACINQANFAVNHRGQSALGCKKIASTPELLQALTQKT